VGALPPKTRYCENVEKSASGKNIIGKEKSASMTTNHFDWSCRCLQTTKARLKKILSRVAAAFLPLTGILI
jgi:hypothetical protein